MIDELVAFGQAEFELSAPQGDGLTLREHLEGLAERTGKTLAEVAGLPDLPQGCEFIWRDFMALSIGRGSNGFSAARITWADIEAYQRVNGIRFAGWEIDAIRRLDNAFLAEANKRKPKG